MKKTETAAKGKKSNGEAHGKQLKEAMRNGSTLSKDRLIDAYRTMYTARKSDDKILLLLKQGKVFFHIGGSGHEAAQVATAFAMKPGYDWAYPYYRDLPFSLGFGYTIEEVFLEALHRAKGPSSGGFAMPFHWGHKKWRIISQSSPTGTQYLEAVGTAMGSVKEGNDEVTYVSSGEGSTSEGEFHEAINWAAREKLPVIFLIQDNKYAISVTKREQTSAKSVYHLTSGYEGLHRYEVDGCDFMASYETAVDAVKKARKGEGPSLILAHTVRLLPHSSSDDQRKYRSETDLAKDREKDPIPRFEKYLLDQKVLTPSSLKSLQQEVLDRIDKAAETAEAEPQQDPENLLTYVYSPNEAVPKAGFTEPEPKGGKIVMVDAINHAMAEEMERNPKMLVYGEDCGGDKGGVFTATKGLTKKFGWERVFNSPLAEASIIGTAFGLALRGFKPCVEIQFGDYVWPAFMQLRDEVAMLRFRSNNQWSCPMVVRVAVGGYIHGGLYHSQSIDGFFTHIPGLRVVMPSNAADAKGLLKTACRSDDPVIFCEHKGLYRASFATTPEPDADYCLPFGVAKVVREGSDISIITWGMMVQRSMEAARKLEDGGTSVEVIDLRTLNPLDVDSILASVKKTGKVVIVHEDTLTGGFGAEIAAIISSEAFMNLDAPVKRVAAKDAPVPYGPTLENVMLPQTADIVAALQQLAAF
ncbi:MAG TPA: thiamine pyrophosphate-dependent enzyme [Bacteroidota bacterium]|jgi:2-oxoisovalerate dehydrogenase E1 component|nr:thiamine pyrophosphate-dependent enzyme [Bacteroidota bacterium]